MLEKLKFRLVLRLNLLIVAMMNPCRMYKTKPSRPTLNCYLCAGRGGWLRCLRSKRPDMRKWAEEFLRK